MPRLILKSPYLKPNAKQHLVNYTQYVATREGVERPEAAAGKTQRKVIAELLKEYPDIRELYESEDYRLNPTQGNADEFILRAAEMHGELFGTRQRYVDYIANRPGAAQLASHGLFSDDGEASLPAAMQEVADHPGNVWTHILSLRRENAARLGYESVEQWQALLRMHRNTIARHMKIRPENFRWYAAFHNTAHHPHVHLLAFSSDPKEPYLTKEGIRSIKAEMARDIFRQDLISIYQKQTQVRDDLRRAAPELVKQLNSGTYDNPRLERLLGQLSERLQMVTGKKVYGYLRPKDKALVDDIVEELSKDERIARLYDLWYEQRYEVLRTYTDTMPEKEPLSRNKEFKSIRNAVIAEALRLPELPYEEPVEESAEEPDSLDTGESFPEDEPEVSVAFQGKNKKKTWWTEEYKQARHFLYGSNTEAPDLGKAYTLLCREAQKGNGFAMHDAGKILWNGLGRDKDEDGAQAWFSKAYRAFLAAEQQEKKKDYLQYRIGKLFSYGFGVEQSYEKAAEWFEKAVEEGNPFAAFSLAGLYRRGQGVPQNEEKAFALYQMAAEDDRHPNAYAMYELGRMCWEGRGTDMDAAKSKQWFGQAFKKFTFMEAEGGDDHLQVRLGDMHLTGTGTPVNLKMARQYFEKAAKLKNVRAFYNLGKLNLKEGNIQAALENLTAAAREKYAPAQYQLGKLFLEGRDVPPDIFYGVRWLEAAAGQDDPSALALLGKEHLKGTRLPKDTEKALEYLQYAIQKKSAYAAYILGRAYLNGVDLPLDLFQAETLLQQSADRGFEPAEYVLGREYATGERLLKNLPKAVELLTRAAKKENNFAQYRLGKLFLKEPALYDVGKAIHWLEQAAGQDNAYAWYALGSLYYFGDGVQKNEKRALTYLGRATELGNVYARQLLGSIRQHRNAAASLGALRLLRSVGRLFENKLQLDRPGQLVEHKLRQRIQEQKRALGIRE